ncbi:MAG: YciI family protein [Acidimicrobiia bacterium]
MKHYLLSVLQPADGTPPPPAEMAEIGRRLEAFHAELHAADAFVYAGGLEALGTSRVVRPEVVSDGPYAETKEYLGGICIVAAPDDATALEWARKAQTATTLPIEVRAFVGDR